MVVVIDKDYTQIIDRANLLTIGVDDHKVKYRLTHYDIVFGLTFRDSHGVDIAALVYQSIINEDCDVIWKMEKSGTWTRTPDLEQIKG